MQNTLLQILKLHFPLLAALLLETTIVANANQVSSWLGFVMFFSQLALEMSPFFIAQQGLQNRSLIAKVCIWSAGFVLYPSIALMLQQSYDSYAAWSLLPGQIWAFAVLFSLLDGLSKWLSHHHQHPKLPWLNKVVSLNGVLLIIAFFWSAYLAGIFASNDEPLYNQPLSPVLDGQKIFSDLLLFLGYWLQFFFMGLMIGVFYLVNRYWLIRRVLARQGILAFLFNSTVVVLLLTPVLCSIVLLLPLNIPTFTLLPSQGYNPFDAENYIFSVTLLFVGTPIILAFERQQQDKLLLEAAQQQTKTELQLLQQQINPHFLFNTLNNLYALCLTKSDDAPELVMKLANLLRYTVYQGDKQQVSLAQEVSYLKDYLALQKIRSGQKCHLIEDWPEDIEHYQIPPLLLIILLENAFKHGVEKCQKSCVVEVKLRIEQQRIMFICKNSLPDLSVIANNGIGLENLKRRLAILYPNRHQLHSQIEHNQWCAMLTLNLEQG